MKQLLLCMLPCRNRLREDTPRFRPSACLPVSVTAFSPSPPATQGHIWAGGFARGELKGELFRDVPDALAQWRSAGIKTYIYSSGSRGAQVGTPKRARSSSLISRV